MLFRGSIEVLAAGVGCEPMASRESVPSFSVMGPHSAPRSAFYGPEAEGLMVILYPDAFWVLTGVEPQTLSDQMVDASEVLPPDLLAAYQRLIEPVDVDQRVKRLLADLLQLYF
jgi:hypothetical protein